MQTVHTIADLRQIIQTHKRQGQRIGFVPTMGNLHRGHICLAETAKQHSDFVVASIFVNPLQFGANEDLDSYPRTLKEDQAQLAAAGCDLLFAPNAQEMYPDGTGIQTQVEVPGFSDLHCGASRPGHFRGVATVVTKLFGIVQPDSAYFGEKDYQQLAVIRQLTRDLSLPVEIIGVPTIRDAQGLALSSRNGYLSTQELRIAPTLQAELQKLAALIRAGEQDYPALEAAANTNLAAAGFKPDFIKVCRQHDLLAAQPDDQQLVILAAAYLGRARLIDNLAFSR